MSKTAIHFSLTGEYIELIQLLKALNFAESGGHAKQLVNEGMVKLNGEQESRKRAKLRKGDVVNFQGQQIHIE